MPAALSLTLGLWGLRRGGSLWRDEAVTLDVARRPMPELLRTLEHADLVHGLYYLLMHGLFRVCIGVDPLLVLRLPSAIAMAAAAGCVAVLGQQLGGVRAGVLAGVGFAVLPAVQRYAQEGRSYAIVCMLVVWSSVLLVRAVRLGTSRAWAAYAIVLLSACLLHEFAVLVLTAHAVAVPRRARRGWLAAASGVVVGVAPLAACTRAQSAQVAWIVGPDAKTLSTFAACSALSAACAAVLPQARVDDDVGLVPFALALCVLPGLVLLITSLIDPLYVARYVLYGWAGCALLVGGAVDQLMAAGRLPLTAALLAAGITVGTLVPVTLHLRTPASRPDDVTAVAAAIRAASVGADGVLYLPSSNRVYSRIDPYTARGLSDLALEREPVRSATLYGVEAAPSVIRARLRTAHRLVIVGSPSEQPPQHDDQAAAKQQVLAKSFEKCETREVSGTRVSVYARLGGC